MTLSFEAERNIVVVWPGVRDNISITPGFLSIPWKLLNVKTNN